MRLHCFASVRIRTIALVASVSAFFGQCDRVDASAVHACRNHEECWPAEGDSVFEELATSLIQTGLGMEREKHRVMTVREYMEIEEGRPRHQKYTRFFRYGGGMALLLFVAVGVFSGMGWIGNSKTSLHRSPTNSADSVQDGAKEDEQQPPSVNSSEDSADPVRDGAKKDEQQTPRFKSNEGKHVCARSDNALASENMGPELSPRSNVPDNAATIWKMDAEEKPQLWTVLCFVVGHALSASSLTVVNKFAMNKFHLPVPPGDHHLVSQQNGYVWTLVLIQFIFAIVVVRLAGAIGVVKVDALEIRKAINYFPAAGMFMITIVAGNALMNCTNVNTFLIIRALVPVPCALLETALYADPCPPMCSWVGLAITVFGAAMYSMSIGGFEMRSLSWGAIFLTTMPIDGILIKHSISMSTLSSWGLVYYNNVLAAIPLVVYVFFFELSDLAKVQQMLNALQAPGALAAVGLSCAVGIGISFFQLNTRYYISATAFMILGVANKFFTVLWSEIFFGRDGVAPLIGVLLTLGGAVLWQMSVGTSGSVNVRKSSAPDHGGRAMLPFLLTLGALAWAAWVQHSEF